MCHAITGLIAKGRAEGLIVGKKELVLAMHQNGISRDEIMKMGSISEEEMEQYLPKS